MRQRRREGLARRALVCAAGKAVGKGRFGQKKHFAVRSGTRRAAGKYDEVTPCGDVCTGETCGRGSRTKLSLEQLQAKYAACPIGVVQTERDGKRFAITRHFTQDVRLARRILELAVRRADREAGI